MHENKLYLCLMTNYIYTAMTDKLNDIKQLINDGDTETAIGLLTDFITTNVEGIDVAYYLMGNAFRKQGNWQGALNSYQEAIQINPESPAADARAMVMDILNFYNKDMINQ